MGLGSIVGGIVGGVGGFVASGFNPMGALAGYSIGSSLGGYFDEDGNPTADYTNADAATKKRVDLARAQEKKWESVYGPIQTSLAREIRTMSESSVSALGLKAVEQEFEKAGIQARQSIARRHLEGSGLEQELAFQSSLKRAESRAAVRAEAPEKIRAAKQNFLNLGLSQKNQESLEGRIAGQEANMLANRAEGEANRAQQEEMANAQMMGDVVEAGAYIYGASGKGKPGTQTTRPTTQTQVTAPKVALRPDSTQYDRLDNKYITGGNTNA